MACQRYAAIALTLFIISEIFAGLIMYSLFQFDYVIWKYEDIERDGFKHHARLMGATMIVVNGHGMIIFRMMPDITTRITKYIHSLIYTLMMVACGFAYKDIKDFMTDNEIPKFSFDYLHTFFALIALGLYAFQWLAGVFIYLWNCTSQRKRKQFSALHNFIGVVILQVSIATCTVQLQIMDYEINLDDHYAQTAMIAMVVYGVMINAIVLNPYLEWKLVGPL